MLEKNLSIIQNRISQKCIETNRNISEVKLIAVSKKKPSESIIELNKLGIIDFGENKAQELKEKKDICPVEINWHFIGHLQSNKAKDVVSVAKLIHSVETIKLAKEIAKRANNIDKVQNILIEINTSEEESKFGLTLDDEIYRLAEFCKESKSLNLQGLMTMAPYTNDENAIRDSFKLLKQRFDELNSKAYNLKHLSMGMTNDFEIAIEEGATLVRIGSAIFGNR